MHKAILSSFFLVFFFLNWPALAADYTHTLMHEGQKRDYIVHTPPDFSEEHHLPVVILFHGGGGNPEGMIRQSGMNTVADSHGFVAVYPAGTRTRIGNAYVWNAGECCGRAVKENIDDVGFVSSLIDQMATDYNIDMTRVYATGHSNGAMMSYRLACELSDRIAAIAPNAGTLNFPDCKPKRPIPILHLHGTEDPCVNYSGGEACGACFTRLLGKKRGEASLQETQLCGSVPDSLSVWAEKNGCGNQKIKNFKQGAVQCETWQGCNVPVTLCSIEGAGHTWAGGNYAAKSCHKNEDSQRCGNYKKVIGRINNDVKASEMMWAFFLQHSKER